MASESYELELFPNCKVTLAVFDGVENCQDLKRCIMEGKVDAALLNVSMIIEPFQVLVAANKSFHVQQHGKMKTRNINSEILFNLSPTNNISESFKRFGVSNEDKSLLAVVLNDSNGEKLQRLTEQVEGTRIDVDQLKDFTDEAKIKKVYKIQDTELTNSTLLDAVICRMATKDAS